MGDESHEIRARYLVGSRYQLRLQYRKLPRAPQPVTTVRIEADRPHPKAAVNLLDEVGRVFVAGVLNEKGLLAHVAGSCGGRTDRSGNIHDSACVRTR